MVSVSASLIGVNSPRTVQVVVSGLTVGAAYEVVGNWSGGSWPIRAGAGTATDTQRVLSDLAAPINIPITYTVKQGTASATSAPITVTYSRRYVLQSLSGKESVAFDMIRNGAPREMSTRQAMFAIPRRARPVVRYDIAGGESGVLLADTTDARTTRLRAMLRSGAPMLLRTDGDVLDLDAVEFLAVTGVSSSLLGMTRRRWSLNFEVLDDPEPDTLTGLPTWDDFDAAYTVVPTVLRTNLIRNPSLEVDTTLWAAGVNCSIARSTARAVVGTASLAMTATAAGDMSATAQSATGQRYPVTAGQSYSGQARFRAAATARTVRTALRWTDGAGTVIGTTDGANVTNSTTAWTTATVTGTAPTGATEGHPIVLVVGCAASEVHNVDAVMVEAGSTVGTYFDGASPRGTYKYGWTGTAHASTSTESTRELTWGEDFDPEWAGSTWNAFDTHDWASRAAS